MLFYFLLCGPKSLPLLVCFRPILSFSFTFFFLLNSAGDGLAFRDFLGQKFPDLGNKCVGRAGFSKSKDWACEACFAIYPLYPAKLQYTIETLILDANSLRDSILVRLEMVSSLAHPLLLIQTLTIIFTPNQTCTGSF